MNHCATMGNMVPIIRGWVQDPKTMRRCRRCDCVLSRYAAWSETRCAPCQLALGILDPVPEGPVRVSHPAQTARTRTTPCACGGVKHRTAAMCIHCRYARSRRSRAEPDSGKIHR